MNGNDKSATAQEAVGEVYWNNETGEIEVNWLYGDLAPAIGTKLYAAPVAAATGIDLWQFREAVTYWLQGLVILPLTEANAANLREAKRLLALIDASPKGDEAQQAGAQAMVIAHTDGYRWNGQHWQKDSPKGVMCGGCGNADEAKRCLGCTHDFHGGCGACGDGCVTNPRGCVVAEQSPPVASPKGGSDAWREGWALAYSGAANLYGDDGELQDNSELPCIDWRRDSADVIRGKITERSNRKIAAMQATSHGAGVARG